MVPVALNANRIPDDDAGKFFQKIMKQSGWPQGIWIASPEGKVLAFHYLKDVSGESPAQTRVRWVRETLEAIDAGLKAFGPVTPRTLKEHDSMPDRGVGLREEGGVRLACYVTGLRKGQRDGDPVVDSVILSADDWKTFQPPKLDGGAEWSIPEAVVKKLAPALSPMTDSIYAPQTKDAKSAKLTCRIQRVETDRIFIRLDGNLKTEHFRDGDPKLPIRATAEFEGYAYYDTVKKQMTSLLLVFHGSYRNVPPWDQPKATASVVEWNLKANQP